MALVNGGRAILQIRYDVALHLMQIMPTSEKLSFIFFCVAREVSMSQSQTELEQLRAKCKSLEDSESRARVELEQVQQSESRV